MSACVCFHGCAKQADGITLGQWIKELDDAAGIGEYSQEQPYYANVTKDSEYYPYVQSSVEWEVLDPSYSFDPDQYLDKEWAAGTLMNLLKAKEEDSQTIYDIHNSPFAQQINDAVAKGLMSTDQRNLFHPHQMIKKTDAEELLKQTVSKANHQEMKSSSPVIEWKQGIRFVDTAPVTFNERTLEGTFAASANLKTGDVVHWKNAHGIDVAYVVGDMTQEGTHQKAELSPFQSEDEVDSLQMSGHEELDFDKAQVITDPSGVIEQSSHEDTAQGYLHPMSMQSLKKEFQFQGFTVNVACSGSSISARASRTMPYGTEIAASVNLNHVNVDYAWNSREHDLENAYFKIDFDSNEALSVSKGISKDLYGDFSKVNSSDFLSSLKNLYQEKNDAEDTTLSLCKIVLPIPEAPVLNISLNLELHLSASGKAELTLTQANSVGFETRNGQMRMIKDSDGKAEASVKATTQLLAGIRIGLNLMNGTLMDAGVNAGAEGNVKTTAHLYDETGNMTDVVTEIPADTCEKTAAGNPNVLICTDVNAHWVLNVLLNSSKSIAGKFGMDKEFDILNEDNAPLIPCLNKHFENGHAVDFCTRKSRKILPTAEGITTSKHICLKDYSFAVKLHDLKQIEIETLPEGYTLNDLVFESSHEEAASVDSGGCVHGNSPGSAVITIHTKDQVHSIHCNVIVPESE